MPYNYPCRNSSGHVTSSHCSICQQQDGDAIIRTQWSGKSEPQIMYWLFFSPGAVTDWTNYMNHWSPSLHYAAVFVHQRPYVRFNSIGSTPVGPKTTTTHRCELGDLLVVFTDTPASRRVAALFQAKKAGGAWPPISPNPDQWELYTTWPSFSYNPNPPNPKPGRQYRTLPFSGGNDPAAQYLTLTSTSPAKVETTEAISSATCSFWDRTVNRVLNGGAGRDFAFNRPSSSGPPGNDWDELIWDLLDHTWHKANPVASAATGGASAPDRGVGTFLKYRGVIDETQGKGPDDMAPGGEDEGWGIPIIHITNDRG